MITSVKSRTWSQVPSPKRRQSALWNNLPPFLSGFLCRLLFLSSITVKTFTARAYEYHGGCLIRNMNCLPFASTPVFCFFFVFFWKKSVLLIFLFVVLFRFALSCAQCFCVFGLPILTCPSVFSGLPILTCPSVFSNVYLITIMAFPTLTQYYYTRTSQRGARHIASET